MDSQAYLAQLAVDLARIAAVAESAPSDRPVPECSPWTVDDLLVHLAQIWAYIGGSIEADAALERSSVVAPEGSAADWQAAASRRLLDVLGGRDAGSPTWTISPDDGTVGFWMRRLCHEAAIHRYDIEAAVGEAAPIPRAVAVDGIDEVFDFFIPNRNPTAFAADGGTLHLHEVGVGAEAGEWFITRTPDGVRMEHRHDRADVAARGTASDLLLVLWGRRPPSVLEVFGEASLLDDWQEQVTF